MCVLNVAGLPFFPAASNLVAEVSAGSDVLGAKTVKGITAPRVPGTLVPLQPRGGDGTQNHRVRRSRKEQERPIRRAPLSAR